MITLSCVSQLRQRTVSQQTSFDAPGLRSPAGRVRRLYRCNVETVLLCSCLNTVQLTRLRSVLKGERESPSFRRNTGPSHRRHVRTIQEVRTTITRIITDVYYEDGKEVDRKVVEVTDG